MWQKNVEFIPEESEIRLREEIAAIARQEAEEVAAKQSELDKIQAAKNLKNKQKQALKDARAQAREFQDAKKKQAWANPLGLLLLLLFI